MQSRDSAETFEAENGEQIIIGNIFAEPLIYGKDGKFFEWKRTGFGGSPGVEYDISFEDPHHDLRGRFHRKGDIITWNEKQFHKVPSLPIIEVIPLPKVRKLEYFFRIPSLGYVYVSADKYNYDYDTFRLFVGTGPDLEEAYIISVERHSDGGTTWVRTVKGTLFVPTSFTRNPRPALWDGTPLEKLDPTNYEIIETEETARLVERKQR